MTTVEVGESLPPLTQHAVSVSLPTWRSNVGYEEGEEWVVSKMKTGYPRFYIHNFVTLLAETIVNKYGQPRQQAILFPSHAVAARCLDFFTQQDAALVGLIRIVDLVPNPTKYQPEERKTAPLGASAVLYPEAHSHIAKAFWQHSGEGMSSRRAEWCQHALKHGILLERTEAEAKLRMCKGPKRYQKGLERESKPDAGSRESQGNGINGAADTQDSTQFVEERFGRNLDVALADAAKLAIRRRIAGSLTADVGLPEALQLENDEGTRRDVSGFSEDDIYLYPTGMSAIFNTHRILMAARTQLRSISYGFPYIDTLKILQKFGPGCLFYGRDGDESLNDLEKRLKSGERYLALFCEFPGNPLLRSPDLQQIRGLADRYDFFVVIDETIGNFLNVNVLPYADVVVSSLTKVFSGDSNVMGGSAILNPRSKAYTMLKESWAGEYEDNMWPEDAIFLERNSRDFVSRIDRINANAEAICDVLREHPSVEQVNYPKHSATRRFYDQCRNPAGGYGGLLSATFARKRDAIRFFDSLDTAKGPSLGTNFTLSSPYVILAHYGELEWAASFGVEADLIRFSVGLEDTDDLVRCFRRALTAISDGGDDT